MTHCGGTSSYRSVHFHQLRQTKVPTTAGFIRVPFLSDPWVLGAEGQRSLWSDKALAQPNTDPVAC